MSNNKQSSVDWLINFFENGVTSREEWLQAKEQAKAMRKQEMIDFADNYVDNCVIPNENMAIPTIMDVPQYYNETFGK